MKLERFFLCLYQINNYTILFLVLGLSWTMNEQNIPSHVGFKVKHVSSRRKHIMQVGTRRCRNYNLIDTGSVTNNLPVPNRPTSFSIDSNVSDGAV
jgi:hypothetical protein